MFLVKITALDWIIVASYCATLIGVAFHYRRRAAKSVEGFFVGGRSFSWWVLGMSSVVAYTGGGQAFVMIFYLGGFSYLWLVGTTVAWVIWMPLVAVIWAKMWRRLGVVTTGEFIESRYGGRAARVYRNVYAIYACLAWGLTCLAYVGAWMAATLAPILGWSNGKVLAVFGLVTLVYLLLSGFIGVTHNNIIQFLLIMAGNTAFGFLLIWRCGGFGQVWSKVASLRGEQLLNAHPWGGDITGLTLLALCVQGLFIAGSPYAGEGFTAQRYMAARTEFDASLGQIFSAFLTLVVRLIPFILLGLAGAALYSLKEVTVPAQLWGEMVKTYAPPGLLGLLLVGGLAGYMGGISILANWAASYPMNDLYRLTLRPRASEREYIFVSRAFSAVLLVAALVWGALVDPKKLDVWVLFINSALVVFPLPLAWLKWFWWRLNVYGDLVGVLGAFPAGYVVWFGSDQVLPASFRAWWRSTMGWNLDGLVPRFGDLHHYPFWIGFSILFGLGWISTLLATFLTRPEPMEVLRAFYQRVRPMGWWGPVRAGLPPEVIAAAHAEARRDVRTAVYGICFYFVMVIAFFALMGGHGFQAAVFSGFALLSGWLFLRAMLRRAPEEASQRSETSTRP